MSIKFDPNEKSSNDRSGDKVQRKPDQGKFKEQLEKPQAKLKKHSKGMSEEGEDLDELTAKSKKEKQPSLFDLSSTQAHGRDPNQQQNQQMPFSQQGEIATGFNIESKSYAQQTSPIQKIVDKLVEQIQIIESQGKTETVVQLNHPTTFRGAKVVIQSFESAKGEFNITFENLTQQAKALLDQNLNSLHQNLEQKGYVAHIISTTTLDETTTFTESETNASRDQDDSEKEDERRQQKDEEAEEK